MSSKSIRVTEETYAWLRERATREQRTMQGALDALRLAVGLTPITARPVEGGTYRPGDTFRIGSPIMLDDSGAAAGHAPGDPEVRRSVGGSKRGPRADASVPVRLGQGASIPNPDPLHGIPEVIGTSEDFPLTHRSEYLGIDRGVARCACQHLQTIHRHDTGRCEFPHCDCRKFAPEGRS